MTSRDYSYCIVELGGATLLIHSTALPLVQALRDAGVRVRIDRTTGELSLPKYESDPKVEIIASGVVAAFQLSDPDNHKLPLPHDP